MDYYSKIDILSLIIKAIKALHVQLLNVLCSKIERYGKKRSF